ncbi:MAG: GlcG/HbpS family heme-binding protein [Microbacterium sp.]|uniref:GlcG/HbpS family heme-binding protein n=1 Tax=Microbacterium sp. TaxID=51671 RepID=UPI003F95237A
MSVTLEDARGVIAAAEKRADEIGQPMNIAVVDAGGNLVAHVRQDGAWIGSVNISINKAWTSKAFDISTKDLGDNSQPTQQFFGIQNTNGARSPSSPVASLCRATASWSVLSASAEAPAIKTTLSPKLAQLHFDQLTGQ